MYITQRSHKHKDQIKSNQINSNQIIDHTRLVTRWDPLAFRLRHTLSALISNSYCAFHFCK